MIIHVSGRWGQGLGRGQTTCEFFWFFFFFKKSRVGRRGEGGGIKDFGASSCLRVVSSPLPNLPPRRAGVRVVFFSPSCKCRPDVCVDFTRNRLSRHKARRVCMVVGRGRGRVEWGILTKEQKKKCGGNSPPGGSPIERKLHRVVCEKEGRLTLDRPLTHSHATYLSALLFLAHAGGLGER